MSNFWLIKSEPDEFSIDDLERAGTDPWTGVRNYQARNYMRDQMQVGDLALFYHSSTQPPGVVGIAQVTSKPYPDPTALDPKSDYYEPRATPDNPVWMLVDISFVEKFPRQVTLDELRATPALEGIGVVRPGNRLSIQPVSAEHFVCVKKMGHSHL